MIALWVISGNYSDCVARDIIAQMVFISNPLAIPKVEMKSQGDVVNFLERMREAVTA